MKHIASLQHAKLIWIWFLTVKAIIGQSCKLMDISWHQGIDLGYRMI